MKNTLTYKILSRIYGHGRGWVFTPKKFSDLGNPRSIGMTLTRLTRKGTIRRLSRGLYDYPVHHPNLGPLSPSADAVAQALADRDGARIQPSGAYSANLLGLSTQVPMQVVFLTDGPSRKVKIGNQTINLKRTSIRNMALAGKTSGLTIQALRYLGKANCDRGMVSKLWARLSSKDQDRLLKDIRFAPNWVADSIRQISMEG